VLPLLSKVEKVTVEESENFYKQLREYGFSKKTTRNIVRLYEEG